MNLPKAVLDFSVSMMWPQRVEKFRKAIKSLYRTSDNLNVDFYTEYFKSFTPDEIANINLLFFTGELLPVELVEGRRMTLFDRRALMNKVIDRPMKGITGFFLFASEDLSLNRSAEPIVCPNRFETMRGPARCVDMTFVMYRRFKNAQFLFAGDVGSLVGGAVFFESYVVWDDDFDRSVQKGEFFANMTNAATSALTPNSQEPFLEAGKWGGSNSYSQVASPQKLPNMPPQAQRVPLTNVKKPLSRDVPMKKHETKHETLFFPLLPPPVGVDTNMVVTTLAPHTRPDAPIQMRADLEILKARLRKIYNKHR